MLQRDLDLWARRRVGPAQQMVAALDVVGERRDAVVGEHLLDELAVLGCDHLFELRLEVLGIHTFGQLDLGRHHEVDAVRLAVNVLFDPFQLDLELVGREVQRAQHAHASRPGHRGDDIAAMAEGEDGDVEAEVAGELRAHDARSYGWAARTCNRF